MLKGTANVAEFNCDDGKNKAICSKEGIRGFPTLTLSVFFSSLCITFLDV